MKTNISIVDLYFILPELEELTGAIVDKIFHANGSIFIRFYSQKIGKKVLVINKRMVFLMDKKPSETSKSGFCELLRKYLGRAKVISVKQIPGQRILEICLGEYILFVELFSKGNIILCDTSQKIIGALHKTKIGRVIQAGEKYELEERTSLFDMKKSDLVNYLLSSTENCSKSLAGFVGKTFAFEICHRSGIESKQIISTKKEAEEIYATVNALAKAIPKPVIYFKEDEIIETSPVELETFREHTCKHVETVSHTFRKIFQTAQKPAPTAYDKKLEQINRRIKTQEERMKKLQKQSEEYQKIGELIYTKYAVVQDVLDSIHKARETMSWKEIKAKLKGHKIVKSINEKTGEIIVEI